ncbi:hypothetical protein BHE74_00032880 [Ensete ventricosum]|nr:hypothetical protein BHE74_00032880 [Ensete ventricosum]
MQRWSAARIFSYKEIKAATNNFRDVIGSGGFGSVYLGKLSDGKLMLFFIELCPKDSLLRPSTGSGFLKNEHDEIYDTIDGMGSSASAKPYLQADSFEIVDENIKGAFNPESMKKAASVAIRCVERDASHRPTIAEVLAELKEAYSIQLTSMSSGGHQV